MPAIFDKEAGKSLTFSSEGDYLIEDGRMQVKQHAPAMPIAASPPKIAMGPAVRGWAALVLAVAAHSRLSHEAILRHEGRSGKRLADARRLLVWAFMEVVELPEDLATAWLEQCLQLGRRSILDALRRGEPPAQLAGVLATYSRLMREMGPEDVREAVTAGILGERRPRATVWPKGLLERLGLQP